MISNCLNELRLVCFAKYVIGFKKGGRMGAKFIRQYVFKGKISRFRHYKETMEQKGRINGYQQS
ncbi:hypothetical protein DPMN_169023 [Dreissena polymorpha]|uniref:Uncharacterized protein n=1 Tax=Dreissena polymorpha TaxID=45954 RepID=A0A9D4F3S9_DREPO|nr:hypothetical protein DPMN_169023 [Dreissena polymorpha]